MKKILLLLLIFVSGCTGVVAQQFDYGKIELNDVAMPNTVRSASFFPTFRQSHDI